MQRQLQLLHPLLIALKRKHLTLILYMLQMIKLNLPRLCLDLRDENRNTVVHHIFQLFQEDASRPLAREICETLLGEPAAVKLNETNKQGMTPLDLAIELRINEAVEVALAKPFDVNH